jgi:GNAT superfamily N-acetyltransferase
MVRKEQEAIIVRQVEASDIDKLAELVSLSRGRPVSSQEMLDKVGTVRLAGGIYLVAQKGKHLTGFASSSTVPGIKGWYNLNLFTHPNWRQQGVGRALMLKLKEAVERLPEAELLLGMSGIEDGGTAQFAKKMGMTIDKYDWYYELSPLEKLPAPHFPPGVTVHHYNDDDVEAERFVKLHYRSFADTPYFQPYIVEEVRQELAATPEGEIIFACDKQGQDVGMVWLRLEGEAGRKTVVIEPLGIVPEWRRKGLGLALMLMALQRAGQRGAVRSELVFQSWNTAARQLYESMGYRQIGGKVTYILRLNQSH